MYGIGVFEILLIFLVLLLFFKPEEIWRIFRRLGTWYRKAKSVEEKLRKDWDSGIVGDGEEFGFDVKDESEKGGDNP